MLSPQLDPQFAEVRMRQTALLLLVVCASACGSSSPSNPPPTTPTPPAPAANRAPVITSVTVNPTFGVADLVTFNFTAIASDPDGDTLTYAWNLAGNSRTGPNASIIFVSPGGNGQA